MIHPTPDDMVFVSCNAIEGDRSKHGCKISIFHMFRLTHNVKSQTNTYIFHKCILLCVIFSDIVSDGN